jgi:RND superfamily putative drug exporter
VGLESVGRWCYRRRRAVVGLWLVAVVGVGVLGATRGGALSNNLVLPNTESQRAFDVLRARFPELAGDTAIIAFRSSGAATDPAVRAPMERLFADVGGLPHVVTVVSPYGGGGAGVSRDGHIAYATIQFNARATEVPKSVMFAIRDKVDAVHLPGVQVALGGESVRFAETKGPGEREGVGLVAAVVILLIAFGSAVAMGLPLLTAGCGIGVSFALLALVANVMDINSFSSQVASMVGLGVGIDYALFIVTRFREGLARDLDVEEAVVRAMGTAGRSVVLAGVTVVVALMAMLLTGVPFIYGFAVGPSIAVLVMVVASVTLLPAVLGFIGRKIDSLRLPGLRRGASGRESKAAERWSRGVQRRPWLVAITALLILGALATPLLSIRLGWAGSGANPTATSPRRAYDLLAQGFGPGFNEPLLLVASLPGPGQVGVIAPLLSRLAGVPGVAIVTPPRLNAAGDVAAVAVFPSFAPQAKGTDELIRTLRASVIPSKTNGTGATVYVAGISPLFYDMARVISVRLPFIIAGVLALSFLLLMAVFRSVLVPLKAVVMNLLSIGAAYGVVVAVFQWGWLGSLAGIDRGGPIESFVPIILFAILFGLSMDYEVFLLSRIREEYQRTGDNSSAVAGGLASTARVITAAAAIMVTLFLSFVLGDERIIKMIGLGLAVAVLVDATLVRMLLVPATMELLGRANWWLPRWLDRVIPTLRIEAEPAFAGSVVPAPLSLSTTPRPDGVPPGRRAEQPPPRRIRQREY